MDYSKLSDAEINWKVAFHIGLRTVEKAESGDFNPCNNPSDAWPIIEKYRISFLDQLTEWCVDAKGVSPVFEDNPLRGAMIVFLMMQESANVQDNPA
ncbi:phage protein NinX family protein [Citrobacter portucalensis]|uniref:phage protein NinX family protein n=1 Tax=Citrobacter portucalensis TaxID=1639133 RepID=UPI003EE197E7